MAELSPALVEHLTPLIPKIAHQLHRSYRHLEADDIAQEMWAGALGRAEHLSRLLSEGETAILAHEMRRAGWRACRDDERSRRAEKAAQEGYKPDDEQFYTIGLLRVLLPAYFDGGISAEPPKGRSQGRGGLLSESGDYLAMMVDISRGMARIRKHEATTLKVYFSSPQGDDPDSRFTRNQLASSMGLTLHALVVRADRALRSLQRELGGDNPWPRRSAMTYDTEGYTNKTNRTASNPESSTTGRPSRSQELALRSAKR